MELLIAIPALNEEESIESIIQRSIEAREFICANSPVTRVSITVVSDGSTDRTVERASRYTDEIELIVFPRTADMELRLRKPGTDLAPRCWVFSTRWNLRSAFFATLCETAAASRRTWFLAAA